MLEGYLDSEEKYWDYGTGVISGNNVVDRYHTGISFYDQFFDPSEFKYLRDNKNLQGKVVMMTPEEYYEECAKYCWPGKNITPDSLKRQRSWDTDVIEKLKNVIFKYKRKLCMPMINYADPGQEGLHRMYVIGEIYGWDFKVPVLQVRHADEDRAKRAAEEKRKSEIDWKVERAISDTLLYKFSDTEDFKSELRHHLYTQFQFSDDIKIPENLQLEEIDEAFILSIAGYEYPIEKDEIKWAESSKDELDDLDLDDTEDFLIRYFGDDWRETYPHLKDKFHITESVEKQLPKYLYHATYRNRWNAIKKSGGLKTHVRKRYWDDSRDVICMSEDPWVAESYAEEADDASDYELDNIVILKIDTSALDLDYLDIDGNILRDDDEELKNTEYEYSKDIPITAISLFNKKLDLVEPSIIQSNELEEDFSNNNEFLHSLLDELSEFDYAFIGANGGELDNKEAMKAVVQHPDQLNKLRKGVCTDFVEYTRTKLDERKIPYKVYDIVCTDKDGDHPAHVFVIVENKGKFLWLEAAWHSEAGIHEYNSLEELFEDIARKHCIYDGENYLKSCEIREIKKSLVGMSQEAIYDYVDTLPITWKAAEVWLKNRLNNEDISIVDITEELNDEFLSFEFYVYSKIITDEIKAMDTNHMIFSPALQWYKFSEHKGFLQNNDNFFKVLNKFYDAMAFTHYSTYDIFNEGLNNLKLNIPVFLNEFSLKGLDKPEFEDVLAGPAVATQKERAKYFEFIASQCLKHKNCIGYTWYQYSDIALTNGGIVNRGIVDPDGNPYPELYESMKKINSNAELLQQ